MELSQFLGAIRRWWWIILASVVVAAVTSYLVTRATPNTYQSRTTLLVGSVSNPNAQASDLSLGQTLAQVYAELALREPVLRGTLEALKLDWDWQALRERVSAHTSLESPLIEISVVDTNPERAKIFADQIARQLILQGPAGSDAAKALDRDFTLKQMDSLEQKIIQGEEEFRTLDDAIANATSRREIEEARSRQIAIDTQIAAWRSSYAQFQANLLKDNPNSLTVLEPAIVPSVPVGPKVAQNVLLAAVVGLVLAIAAILLLELIDDTIKTSEDGRRVLNLPMLGSVARIGGSGYADRLVTTSAQYSQVAEAYRVLRTNLQFSSIERPLHVLMITSSKPKEGKSTTAANLAAVIAQSGKRVILVDADLRRPVQHLIFELNNDEGLTSAFLDNTINVDRYLKPVTADSLSVLPSGPIPHNPSELLDSERMVQILDELKKKADLVIVDSPPILSVADATILASRVDGVLVVVDSGYTRRGLAKRAKETLQRIGANVVGVVVNRAPTRGESDYDYNYSPQIGAKKKRSGVPLLSKPRPSTAGAANGALKPVKLTKPLVKTDSPASNGKGGATERAN